jgi:hypothetical protein
MRVGPLHKLSLQRLLASSICTQSGDDHRLAWRNILAVVPSGRDTGHLQYNDRQSVGESKLNL